MPLSNPFEIERTDPNLKTLQKKAKREKDGELVRRLQAIIILLVYGNAEIVFKTLDISKDTLVRWVQRFNEGGIEGLAKKNDLEDLRS
jgi:transposase